MSEKVDPPFPQEEYKPKLPDYEKIRYYKDIDPTGCELKAHERDYLMPEPQILKPPPKRTETTLDDITDFPQQKVVPLGESRHYEEGKYRPPSMPVYAGIFPSHVYLYRGKVYDWCSCGHTQNSPWCDGQCKWILTRNRPIQFNVSESGHYKLCNCKISANSPFCNGSHQTLYRWAHRTHRGFWSIWGVAAFWMSMSYWMFTFYK